MFNFYIHLQLFDSKCYLLAKMWILIFILLYNYMKEMVE